MKNVHVLSEPPDIRKWYSSYVYESPLLDTNDVSSKNECGENELVNEECIKDDFADSGKFQQNTSDKICLSKVVERKNESHPLFSGQYKLLVSFNFQKVIVVWLARKILGKESTHKISYVIIFVCVSVRTSRYWKLVPGLCV